MFNLQKDPGRQGIGYLYLHNWAEIFFRCGMMWAIIFFQSLRGAYSLPTMGAYAALSSKAFAYAAYAREVLCGLCLHDFSLGQIFELGNGHLMG